MLKSKTIFLFVLCLALLLGIKNAKAIEFDPNNIISDEEMLDHTTMSLSDIQSFLESKGSYLANYTCPNWEGVNKKASEIIYEATTNNYDCEDAEKAGLVGDKPTMQERAAKCASVKINPKFILVLLQKEQSLIEDATPRQSQLDWALGYGCPDGRSCYEYYRGFGKQVNSAVLQYFDYIANPKRYTYQVGTSYTVTNTGKPTSTITPANRATAGLYNYTPHVYNGNYNFFKLWQRYFIRSSYSNNTLMQVKGEAGVWLIQNGKRRAFMSKSALTSRYDIKKIITVNKSELENYPIGDPIKFPQYSLVRNPKKTVYLLVDDKKRMFINNEAFRRLGFNPEEITEVTDEELAPYADGENITENSSYPTGALLQNKKTGGVYWVSEETKAPVIDRLFLKTSFKYKAIHPVSPEKLDKYKTTTPYLFGDGELLKGPLSAAVYLVDGGKIRAFTSGKLFEDLGYKWANIILVSDKIIKLYSEGDPILAAVAQPPTEELLPDISSTTPGMIDCSTASTSSSTDCLASSTLDVSTTTLSTTTTQ